MPEQRLVAFYLTTRRCREVDLDQATGSCLAYIKVPVTEPKMVLSVKLDSASVRSGPVPLRTAVAEAAAASLPTRSSERPIDSEDRELLRFSYSVDQAVHAALARMTGGLSPAVLAEAYLDWAIHLAISPGKQAELVTKSVRKWNDLAPQMQRHGYYASVQGPWLVCSKSKKQHDTMLFAAQAAQVLAEANMMLIPLPNAQHTESSLAA